MAMWVFILGLGTFFVFRSAHLIMRLRSDPPLEFVETRPDVKPEQLRAEERLARAYWECAAKTVQARYSYGSNLPAEPLPEFKVDSRTNPEVSTTAGRSRGRYWKNLRRVWGMPQAWEQTIQWDTNWLFQGQ
jgi:hypothetical protein